MIQSIIPAQPPRASCSAPTWVSAVIGSAADRSTIAGNSTIRSALRPPQNSMVRLAVLNAMRSTRSYARALLLGGMVS